MAIIVLSGGRFCLEDEVAKALVAATGLTLLDDAAVVGEAARLSGKPESQIWKAFSDSTSVFNKFTMEKEIAIAHMKQVLSNRLTGDSLVIPGYTGLLIPKAVSHTFRTCLVADISYKTRAAVEKYAIPEKEAAVIINRDDRHRAAWTHTLTGSKDPIDPSFFDTAIYMDRQSPSEAAKTIMQHAAQPLFQPSPESRQAVEDFRLAARVETALFGEGHHVDVSATSGDVTLVINRHVLMIKQLEDELRATVEKIDGVKSVAVEAGKNFHKSQVYRKHDFGSPSRVLLVDDEREFAQTLSERLMIRDVGAAVAPNGREALSLIERDPPEVMVIDLKMPDISGMELLKKVKRTWSEIEVVVLTGHGSDADRETCLNMGAFAYLQKPVEIEELNKMIHQAHRKIQALEQASGPKMP
ncbi:MAG: response regulator [Deltaproteobacteria bacterium]|nr:MAG: response regulator [Deltaproteobacteria bacterium]